MKRQPSKRFFSMLLAAAMLLSLLPLSAITATPVQAAFAQEDAEYPTQAQYDFELPGSTISFLDQNGELLTEELAWTEGENVVHTWHVFLYRTNQADLKLGYSIGAYCSSMAKGTDTMADLAKATAVYGYHAKAYFG